MELNGVCHRVNYLARGLAAFETRHPSNAAQAVGGMSAAAML